MKRIYLLTLFILFSVIGYSQVPDSPIILDHYIGKIGYYRPAGTTIVAKDSASIYMLRVSVTPSDSLQNVSNYKIAGYGIGQDSFYVSYCSGCAMTTGWKLNGDTLKIDTCYVNTIIKDSLHALDTGKVSTSGDVMYGDLTVNADVHADTLHATVKQSVYLNSLASWDSQGVLNDTIILKNVSDTLYNKILAIRPNKPDTSISNIDLIANTTLFPKGTYFHVYKGSYTVTVNIARDSCVQYFDAGAIVTKTTVGAIFDYSNNTYINPIKILGFGNFTHTTNSGEILLTYGNSAITEIGEFDFYNLNTTVSSCIKLGSVPVYVKGNYAISSGSYSVYINAAGVGTRIDINKIHSTANCALYMVGSSGVLIISDYIYSSTSESTYLYNCVACNLVIGYSNKIYLLGDYGTPNFHYNNVTATCDYFINAGASSLANFTGIVSTSLANGSNMSFSGWAKSITTSTGDLTGGKCETLNISSGTAYIESATYFAITGGKTVIKESISNYYIQGTISDGACELSGDINITANGSCFVVTGGKLVINGNITYGNSYYSFKEKTPIITMSAGTVEIRGTLKSLWTNNDVVTNTTPNLGCISHSGGTLVFNGAVLMKSSSYLQFINCPIANQNIKILSGGVSCNGTSGELLSAKTRKDSVRVTSVSATTIELSSGIVATVSENAGGSGYSVGDTLTLVGGFNNCKVRVATLSGSAVSTVTLVQGGKGYYVSNGYSTTGGHGTGCKINVLTLTKETFTENDVATYNTTALLAARIASLINASATLDITATYVSGSTFNLESDIAGADYIQSGLVNLTNIQLRLNSFAITDLVGGNIIEDSDVIY